MFLVRYICSLALEIVYSPPTVVNRLKHRSQSGVAVEKIITFDILLLIYFPLFYLSLSRITERNGHSSVNTRPKQMQCRGNTGPLRTPLRPRYQQHSCALAPLISDSTGFLAWYLPSWMPLKDPARTGRGFNSQPHVGNRHEGDDVRCLIISDWRLAPCLQQSLPIEVMNTGPGRCGIRRASRPLTTASSSPWSSRKANSDGGDAGGRMSSYSLAFNPSVV